MTLNHVLFDYVVGNDSFLHLQTGILPLTIKVCELKYTVCSLRTVIWEKWEVKWIDKRYSGKQMIKRWKELF